MEGVPLCMPLLWEVETSLVLSSGAVALSATPIPGSCDLPLQLSWALDADTDDTHGSWEDALGKDRRGWQDPEPWSWPWAGQREESTGHHRQASRLGSGGKFRKSGISSVPNKCHQLKEGAEEFGREIRRREMILQDSDTVNSLNEGAG